METIYIIPARLASSRLPNKMLHNIHGKMLIEHVIENFTRNNIDNFLVACDHEDIASICKKHDVRYVLTDPSLQSGTDRVFAAYQALGESYDCIMNVQGDLAVFDTKVLKHAVALLKEEQYDMTTLGYRLDDQALILSRDTVKMAIAFKNHNSGQVLYFSRSPIPHEAEQFYQHVGVYAYRPSTLQKFVNCPVSALEKTEKLEQLRVLENGMKIGVAIVDGTNNVIEVNNMHDAEMVSKYIGSSNKNVA